MDICDSRVAFATEKQWPSLPLEDGGEQVDDSLAVMDEFGHSTTRGDIVADDLVAKLDAYRRNDLFRGMLILAVLGALTGTICFVPKFIGWDHLKIPSTFFAIGAWSVAFPIPGQAIFMGVCGVPVLTLGFLVVMAELALRDLVDGVTEKNVFSFFMILLSSAVTAAFAPGYVTVSKPSTMRS